MTMPPESRCHAKHIRRRRERAVRFILVGSLGSGLYYLLLILQVEVLAVPVLIATCVAFALVVASNYVLHRGWTFHTSIEHRRALMPFVLMSVAGLGINFGVMTLGQSSGIHYLFAQLLAIIVVVAWNLVFTTLIFSQPEMSVVDSSKGLHHGPT